jgi:hypothetical protein
MWELALGATSLVATCIIGALIFFWIGFRIAEVSALVGFEGMLDRQDRAAGGNARAMSVPKRPPSRARVSSQESEIGRIERQL